MQPSDSRRTCLHSRARAAERPAPHAPVEIVRAAAVPLTGGRGDYDRLLDFVGDARFVLIGEASHGTHEFYRDRARITQRFIAELGFDAVAVEADWPDAYRSTDTSWAGAIDTALIALGEFHRFPRWMWRNEDVHDFITWLRDWNAAQPPGDSGRILRARSVQPEFLDPVGD